MFAMLSRSVRENKKGGQIFATASTEFISTVYLASRVHPTRGPKDVDKWCPNRGTHLDVTWAEHGLEQGGGVIWG